MCLQIKLRNFYCTPSICRGFTFLHALQQYFLNGGIIQFLSNCSGEKSSQYCVASVAGHSMGRWFWGHLFSLQRRLRSLGFGPHNISSEAGHTNGRYDTPRPQVVEH